MAWMPITGNFRGSPLPLLIMLALTVIHAILPARQLRNHGNAWWDGD